MRTPHAPTPTVGRKFDAHGRALPFPGSSIVCPLADDAPQRAALHDTMTRVRAAPFARQFAELPADSWHMTVFDLVCDAERTPAQWSSRLPLDLPLDQVDDRLTGWLADVAPWPETLRMRFDDVGPVHTTLHLRLLPADDATAAALQGFREAVSAATGVRHPVHDRYRFHLSLAYLLRWLDDAEQAAYEAFEQATCERLAERFGVLALGRPRLVFFGDMLAFPERRG